MSRTRTRTRTPQTLRLPASRRPAPTKTRVRTRRVPVLAYALLLLALPVAIIGGARASGWWITSGHTVSAEALGAEAAGVAQQSGADTPITGAHDVKGSMTVAQVVEAFPGLTAADILRQFGAADDTPTSTQLKTLAQQGEGYEVSDLREWLETRAPR